jgi:hypothetical protein
MVGGCWEGESQEEGNKRPLIPRNGTLMGFKLLGRRELEHRVDQEESKRIWNRF